MIILAFLAFASQSLAFVVTGDWINGVSAVGFAVAWGALVIWRGNRAVDRALAEEIQSGGYTTPGRQHCSCNWLGKGTPEHDASPLCISLRPNADRDGEKS